MLTLNNTNAFYGDIHVLKNISFEIRDKEITTIVGSNGSGKSTLINMISGLVCCTSGEITFWGEKINTLPAHEIVKRGIIQVPEGRLLFPEMTVAENLEMGAFCNKAKSGTTMEEVIGIFPKLKERREQVAGSLSGGEQQMVAIARGLMAGPKLIIFDEPSLGLAPVVVEEVFRVIEEINKRGIAVLLVEQNVLFALSIANRAIVLENGEIVLEGSGKDMANNDKVKTAYLGL
jgi:branched-chain amino acid transport system ATP-binding protein